MINDTVRQRESESGNAMLELALVLPVLFALAFAGLEFSRSLRFSQLAATLSREAASIAYRSCIADENTTENPDAVSECLELERVRLQASVSTMVAGSHLILSLYRYNSTSGTVERLGISGEGIYQSKFDPGTLPADFIATVTNQKAAVLGESFVPAKAIIRSIYKLFSYNPDLMYDATLI